MHIMQNYNGKKYQGGGIDMATFGELLQELRKDHRLSQKQLADVIAVTREPSQTTKTINIFRILKSSLCWQTILV